MQLNTPLSNDIGGGLQILQIIRKYHQNNTMHVSLRLVRYENIQHLSMAYDMNTLKLGNIVQRQ